MTNKIRLQKILAIAGVASRRKAERFILEGRVVLNGSIVKELGVKADMANDHIKVDGRLITKKESPVYLMLNKPRGFVTTLHDDKDRPTVRDLLKKVKERVFPVGRLDFNTEGLLLLTNDGVLAHGLSHPSRRIPKVYLARVSGIPDEKKFNRLAKGIKINGVRTAPLKIGIERITGKNSWLKFTLIEGKNREIRLLCKAIGHPVSKLKRIKYAFLNLSGVKLGEFRRLEPNEVAALKELIEK